MMVHSPWDQPSYKNTKRKKAKKVAKKLPVAKKRKKAKKKRRKVTTPEVCGLPGGRAAVETVPKRRRSLKVKPKAKAKRWKKCKGRKPPKLGKDMSGWTFAEYEKGKWSVEQETCIAPTGSNQVAVAESRAAQRAMWDAGLIPNMYPGGPYAPGRQPKERHDWEKRPLTQRPVKYGIPKSYGMPDVSWFVDPRVAGKKAGKIIVFFSGGKDSVACLLYMIEIVLSLGLDPSETIECIHHCVDGRPWFFDGPGISEFDWPCTEDYCRVVCECLGIPLLFNWREGGLMGEVLKGGEGDPLPKIWEKAKGGGLRPTPPMMLEMPPGGRFLQTGGIGKAQKRRSFPPHGPGPKAGRTYRWCSAVAKIDLGRSHISNRKDLYGKRILTVSGERAEESKARGHYLTREFESAHGSRARHVERWRPIHRWCETDVWALIERWKIRPHPAYRLSWGRLSCLTCIFGGPSQWASIRKIDRRRFNRFVAVENMLTAEKAKELARLDRALRSGSLGKAEYEKLHKNTRGRITYIKGENLPLTKVADKGRPYRVLSTQAGKRLVKIALSHQWKEDPIMSPWKLPVGAFGESAGPI